MQMWTAIKYVTSGITLVAFICAVAAWLYKSYLHRRERLINSVPEAKRAKLVEQTFNPFKIDTTNLSRQHRYELALMQLKEQTKKYQLTAVVILIIAGLVTLLVFAVIPRTGPLPTVPTPTPTPVPSPTPSSVRLLGEIEDVQIVPGNGNESQVFIRMSIRNTGAATGVGQYAIRINHSQSKSIEFKGFPEKLTKRYTLPRDGKEREQAIVIQPEDSIISKAAQAIAPDSRVSGWLKLTLPLPADVLRQSGMQYTVSFADVDHTSYTTPSYKMQ